MDKICQSCGMPMKKPEDFGTNVDSSQNEEYCHYCFKNGQFTWPEATMEQFIEKLVSLAGMIGMTEEQARIMATTTLPRLKRWSKNL